jgi:hypothetical protein
MPKAISPESTPDGVSINKSPKKAPSIHIDIFPSPYRVACGYDQRSKDSENQRGAKEVDHEQRG